MAKLVGLSRSLKIEWLNKTVDLIKNKKSADEIKFELHEYLSFEIESPTNLRKTRDILLNIWVKVPDDLILIKEEAIALFDENPTNRLVLHYCMMLIAYPVFIDICKVIGKLGEIQGEFTLSVLKQKLFDIWGERTTLYHSTDKILATLKFLEVIKAEKPGKYEVLKHNIKSCEVSSFIAIVGINIGQKAYFETSELSKLQEMFPFEYTIDNNKLRDSNFLTFSNFGGNVMVSKKQ